MTVLLITPTLPAHYENVAAIGRAWLHENHRVVVATGPALADQVARDGFDHRELELGGAEDPAVLDVPAGDGDPALHRRFIEATRRGMLAALRYHADWRQQAPVFRPLDTAFALARILEAERPDLVIADHVAPGAALALRALRQPWVGLVATHPWSVPAAGRPYGYPSVRPAEMRAEARGLLHLHQLWSDASERFTREMNRLLSTMDPDARPFESAWSGAPLMNLFVYPEALGGHSRNRLPARSAFLGATVRDGAPATSLGAGSDARPTVFVTLGERLSARSDVLGRIVDALCRQPLRVLLEHGEADPQALGELPEAWTVAPTLNRHAALAAADLVVGHAGNDLITHSLWHSTPLLVAPFAADQYAGAADVRRAGVGEVFDPDRADAADIAVLALGLLEGPTRARVQRVAEEMASDPGPQRAVRLCRRILEDSRARVA